MFVTFSLLMAMPCALDWTDGQSFHFAKIRFLAGLTASLFIAALLAWPAAKNRAACIIISIPLSLLTFIEMWSAMSLSARLNERVLSLILQTDSGEVSEFFSQYFFTWPTAAAAAVVAAIWLIGLSAGYIAGQLIIRRRAVIAFAASLILSAAVLATGLLTRVFYSQLAYPTVILLAASYSDYSSHRVGLRSLEKTVLETPASIADSTAAPARIVWVIGESFNRHHSPLYGYELPTSPRLMRELADSNLLVFTDVVTPSSSTGHVMEYIFSTYSNGDSLPRDRQPLIPALFRKAGYKVTLHDNQTTAVMGDPKWDRSNMYFFNTPALGRASFDYRNRTLSGFDLDFVKGELDSMAMGAKHALDIFHLMGQHTLASRRYPSEAAVFTAADYAGRSGLPENCLAEIAHYDNATRYNDSVIATIIDAIEDEDAILIYHSDHGEEIHDFREMYGRTLEKPTAEIARCIFEIPLVVYTTPRFRKLHPRLYAAFAAATQRPVTIADIGHLLLETGCIATPYFKPSRSAINPTYTPAERRISYPPLDYDSLIVAHAPNKLCEGDVRELK